MNICLRRKEDESSDGHIACGQYERKDGSVELIYILFLTEIVKSNVNKYTNHFKLQYVVTKCLTHVLISKHQLV